MLKEFSFPTLVAEATRLEGEVTFFSAAHVFGVVDGNIVQQANEPIQIGKSGWVHGSIQSRGPVIVAGRVDGDIETPEKVTLLPTASVRGKLQASNIEVRPGAVIDGTFEMSSQTASQPIQNAA